VLPETALAQPVLGKPVVERFETIAVSGDAALAGDEALPPAPTLAAALARHSTHPLSQAVAKMADAEVPFEDWQEVRGAGVVGEQPHLAPGESFQYTSGAAIATPVGTMRGSYQMIADDGTHFDAPIPEFTLSIPRVLH
jgi:cation transport ATPase